MTTSPLNYISFLIKDHCTMYDLYLFVSSTYRASEGSIGKPLVWADFNRKKSLESNIKIYFVSVLWLNHKNLQMEFWHGNYDLNPKFYIRVCKWEKEWLSPKLGFQRAILGPFSVYDIHAFIVSLQVLNTCKSILKHRPWRLQKLEMIPLCIDVIYLGRSQF